MTMKKELLEFLKDGHKRIEDILFECGEINEVTSDTESKNIFIQHQFADALMLLNRGRHDELKLFLERASKRKWL